MLRLDCVWKYSVDKAISLLMIVSLNVNDASQPAANKNFIKLNNVTTNMMTSGAWKAAELN